MLKLAEISVKIPKREGRQETKTKKSRNSLQGLGLPYSIESFLAAGAEGRIRHP
jgi:hypothetical protein